MRETGWNAPMDEQLRKWLFEIIRKNIEIDPATLDPEKPIREQVSLDSMQFVSVIARIELELNIELPISIMEVRTLHEFLATVAETANKTNL
jgi:acyl carrier protein